MARIPVTTEAPGAGSAGLVSRYEAGAVARAGVPSLVEAAIKPLVSRLALASRSTSWLRPALQAIDEGGNPRFG